MLISGAFQIGNKLEVVKIKISKEKLQGTRWQLNLSVQFLNSQGVPKDDFTVRNVSTNILKS